MKIQVVLFWIVTPCNYVAEYRRFGGPRCLHFQGVVGGILKMDTEWSSETFVSYFVTTRCHKAENRDLNC